MPTGFGMTTPGVNLIYHKQIGEQKSGDNTVAHLTTIQNVGGTTTHTKNKVHCGVTERLSLTSRVSTFWTRILKLQNLMR